jgi:hypothetical protein
VAELLDLAQLQERHAVAQVQVGRAGVHAELDAQRLPRRQALLDAFRQLALLDQVDHAAREHGQLALDFALHRAQG